MPDTDPLMAEVVHERGWASVTGEQRFRALWDEHADAVLAYALRRVEADAANDIVAETFLVAWRRLDDIPPQRLPWLYGVARRVVANHRRSGTRRTALVERARAASPPAVTASPADDDAARVLAALARLPDTLRETVTLVALEGLDREDAAGVLGCTTATLAVRLHRARRRLARELDLDGGGR